MGGVHFIGMSVFLFYLSNDHYIKFMPIFSLREFVDI